MPEVTILPDGLQVTTAGERETVLAATGRSQRTSPSTS
jgi:hypothetical protein